MATNYSLILLSLILTSFLTLSSAAENSSSGVDFIRSRCNATSHRRVCIDSLSPYNATVNNNPFLLARIAVNISLHGIRNLTADITAFSKSNNTNTTTEDLQVLHDCGNYLRDALEEIQSAASVVDGMERSSGTELASLVKEASVKLSSAVIFEDTCEDTADAADFTGVEIEMHVKVKWMMEYTSNANALVTALAPVACDLC